MKMHHKRKNRQKSAKIGKNYKKKIDFPYNNFPKKGIFLRKCTQFFFPPSAKKKSKFFFAPAARYTAATPGGGGCYRISSIPVFQYSALIPEPGAY